MSSLFITSLHDEDLFEANLGKYDSQSLDHFLIQLCSWSGNFYRVSFVSLDSNSNLEKYHEFTSDIKRRLK